MLFGPDVLHYPRHRQTCRAVVVATAIAPPRTRLDVNPPPSTPQHRRPPLTRTRKHAALPPAIRYPPRHLLPPARPPPPPPYAPRTMAPSSPDPLQDLDGPSIYQATPVPPRTIKRTASMAPSPSPRKSKKLSHTTIVNTPTRSPWRIHVYVEAERDDSASEAPQKRSRTTTTTTRTKTTKVPLRGLSPSPRGPDVVVARLRAKTTPVRRRGSVAATPGGPGKTPAKSARGKKSATPLVVEEEEEEEEDFDEGIGSMIDGMSVLGDDDDDGGGVEVRGSFWFYCFLHISPLQTHI